MDLECFALASFFSVFFIFLTVEYLISRFFKSASIGMKKLARYGETVFSDLLNSLYAVFKVISFNLIREAVMIFIDDNSLTCKAVMSVILQDVLCICYTYTKDFLKKFLCLLIYFGKLTPTV